MSATDIVELRARIRAVAAVAATFDAMSPAERGAVVARGLAGPAAAPVSAVAPPPEPMATVASVPLGEPTLTLAEIFAVEMAADALDRLRWAPPKDQLEAPVLCSAADWAVWSHQLRGLVSRMGGKEK